MGIDWSAPAFAVGAIFPEVVGVGDVGSVGLGYVGTGVTEPVLVLLCNSNHS